MKTMESTETEKIIDLIGKLPEIEFAEVLGGVAEQMRRNNWNHLIDDYFNIDDHSEELEDMNRELERMENKKDEIVDSVNGVQSDLSDALEDAEDEEQLKEAIQDAIDKLNAIS